MYKPTPFTFMFAGKEGYVDDKDVVTWNSTTFSVKKAVKAIKYSLEMERLRVMGLPDTLRFYDNPRYTDRYTVLFMDQHVPDSEEVRGLGMNYQGAAKHLRSKPGFNLGSRIFFGDLSMPAKNMLMTILEGGEYAQP